MRVSLLGFLLFFACLLGHSQQKENREWCPSDCTAADEHNNYEMMMDHMVDTAMMQMMAKDTSTHIYPLRIGLVLHPDAKQNIVLEKKSILNTIKYLNDAFMEAKLYFVLIRIDTIYSENNIADLSANSYIPYFQFSEVYDTPDTLSLYLFNYDRELCKIEDGSISCGRTGGFSFILSEKTQNVILSNFEINNHKVIAHEFGHFFGLYHTFDSNRFGKELISGDNCDMLGDRICDTPADPPPIFEVYVNYSTCQMTGNTDFEEGLEYSPLIENYMSYYKPCYLKKYSFTSDQNHVMRLASTLAIRSRLRR